MINNGQIALTFADPSPDVKFFQPGDVVQSQYSSITENVIDMTTDNGSAFFDDPDFRTVSSIASDVFDGSKRNPGNSYITRNNAWVDIQFRDGIFC